MWNALPPRSAYWRRACDLGHIGRRSQRTARRPAPAGQKRVAMTLPNGSGSRPTLSPAQVERTRRTRESLIGGGLRTAPPGASGVPRHIEMSWRRCVGDRVPVAPERVDYREPQEILPALRRAATPVLNRLRDSLSDVPVALVLSDAEGRIVVRHAPRQQCVVMDRASAAEGFDYSERSVGTNGIGTALVERRTVLVRGPEHYNPLLEQLTCASTPVVEPGTGRLVGSFSLACSMREVHALMAVMAADVGRQIEARLLDDAGERRRRFVQAYLELERSGTCIRLAWSGPCSDRNCHSNGCSSGPVWASPSRFTCTAFASMMSAPVPLRSSSR